jgi:hypothetical protein
VLTRWQTLALTGRAQLRALLQLARRGEGGSILGATVLMLMIRAVMVAAQISVFAAVARGVGVSRLRIYAVVSTAWSLARYVGPFGLDQLTLRLIPAQLAANHADL